MSDDPKTPGPSRRILIETCRSSEGPRHAAGITQSEGQQLQRHPDYYEVQIINETAIEDSSENDEEDEGDEDEEIYTSRLRKPLLSLSKREKNDICRYKSLKPESSLRQMSEHFTRLWNKIVCRRSIYDVLMQNEKWTSIENRVYQDTESTSDNSVEIIESVLYDWIMEILRVDARVWDEDVRNAATNIREIGTSKGFIPSAAWLADFKYRYGLNTDPNDGSIVATALGETEGDRVERRKRQIRIDIGDGLSYQIDVGTNSTLDVREEKIPPHSQFATDLHVRRGGPHVPPNRMTEFQLSDSDAEEDDLVSVGSQPVPRDLGLEALLGVSVAPSLHDVLKHLVYGASVMSEKAQEMMAAATGVALRAELLSEGSGDSSASRRARRVKLTADLVEKVLKAKRRRDAAEIEMHQEKKLRDLNAFKVAEEKRKRCIERRELHLVQKRILETEEKFFSDQQRNELIRKELLLVESPVASTDTDSGKGAEVPRAGGAPVKRRRLGSVTLIGGAT